MWKVGDTISRGRRPSASTRANSSSNEKGLGDVVVRAGSQGLDLRVDRVLRGEYEHRRAHTAISQRAQHLDAAQTGEAEVQDDDVVLSLGRPLQSLGTVVHQVHLDELLFEAPLDEPPDGVVVFHHENLHDASPASAAGMNTRKVEPRPGWESTTMRPRCCWTMP